MMTIRAVAALMIAAAALTAGNVKPAAQRNDVFSAIRSGDIAAVKTALLAAADVNGRDSEGSTPLMYAALYSNTECMRLLLDRGADPNAANQAGGVALIWAAGNLDKVQLLVERGANVNAQSKLGKTALLAAAGRDDSGPVVQYLIEHGARLDVKDNLDGIPVIPLGGGANTPVIEAAKARDGHALRLLLENGAAVNDRAKNGSTALLGAIAYGNRNNARLLIEKGANLEAAALFGPTPLMLAAMENDEDTLALLLQKSVRVDAEDAAGNTALMWAAYSELDRPGPVKRLLEAGAGINHKNKAGETALTWAARRGETRTVEYLRRHGAVNPIAASALAIGSAGAQARNSGAAVDRALAPIQSSGKAVFQQRGCVSCHNNMLPSIAASMAEARGHAVDTQAMERERKTLLSIIRPARELLIEYGDNIPDLTVTGSWALITLSAQQYEPDATTDALVHNIAMKQRSDGSWSNWAPRPPIEYGDIQPTALSLRALQLYSLPGRSEEFRTRIWKAGKWLTTAIPASTEDENMRLLGLAWAKADASLIRAAAQRLLNEQRADGGWSQLLTLGSDAYATGETLYALHETGMLNVKDAAWKRGVEYLLRTQQRDGTWHVKTRSYPFQPYFESGFPHGPDQWISAAASSWATMALLESENSRVQSPF